MVRYTWKILRVDNYPTRTDSTGQVFYDVIYALQWQITGDWMVERTDAETGETYQIAEKSAYIYDSVGVDIALSDNYTPRSEVTEAQLIEWVKDKLGAEKITELEAQIAQMLEP